MAFQGDVQAASGNDFLNGIAGIGLQIGLAYANKYVSKIAGQPANNVPPPQTYAPVQPVAAPPPSGFQLTPTMLALIGGGLVVVLLLLKK